MELTESRNKTISDALVRKELSQCDCVLRALGEMTGGQLLYFKYSDLAHKYGIDVDDFIIPDGKGGVKTFAYTIRNQNVKRDSYDPPYYDERYKSRAAVQKTIIHLTMYDLNNQIRSNENI